MSEEQLHRHHHLRRNHEETHNYPPSRSDEADYDYQRANLGDYEDGGLGEDRRPTRRQQPEYGPYESSSLAPASGGLYGPSYGTPQFDASQGGPYGSSYGRPVVGTTEVYQERPTADGIEQSQAQDARFKREEEEGRLGGLAAGAFATYEHHEAKKDPEHARRHEVEEEIAGAAAAGAEGYGLYEQHERKKSKEKFEKEQGESGERKHHGWFD